jgi:HD-like signal output (HDOD) protein
VCARILGRTRRVMGEKAFVAGLLHDLGMIVLVCYAKDRFRELYATAEERNVPLEDVELEILGFTSAALGSAVAAEWQFPPGLCDALAHQHDPSGAEADPLLARTVHLADWLAKRLGVGFVGPSVRDEPNAEAAAEFQLTPASLARFETEASIEFEEGQSLRALGKAA